MPACEQAEKTVVPRRGRGPRGSARRGSPGPGRHGRRARCGAPAARSRSSSCAGCLRSRGRDRRRRRARPRAGRSPAAASIAANVGSSGSIANFPSGSEKPALVGTVRMRSTSSGGRPAAVRASVIGRDDGRDRRRCGPSASGRRRARRCSPGRRPAARRWPARRRRTGPHRTAPSRSGPGPRLARAEKPWQATHRWSSVTAHVVAVVVADRGAASRKTSSGSWGAPGVIDDSVSVALSTTTVTISSSSSTVSRPASDAMAHRPTARSGGSRATGSNAGRGGCAGSRRPWSRRCRSCRRSCARPSARGG